MLRVDARHGATFAHHVAHKLHVFALRFHLLGQARDEVELCADQPFGVRLGFGNGAQNVLGGADKIRIQTHFKRRFWVRNHFAVGMQLAEMLDILWAEHLMHRAMTFPQQDFRVFNLCFRQATKLLVRVPHRHLLQRNAHFMPAPATKILVREKQHFFALFKAPFQNLRCVGAGAHNATMFAAKSF